jgi:hypothetical protein
MGLLSWLRKLFKRKKATHVITSTAQSRYKNFSIKPTTTEQKYVKMNVKVEPATLKVNEEEIKEVLNLLPKRKPITHPARYRKFFKRRQPTTARKLWKKNAKIDEEDEDANVIFKEDD